MDFDEMLRIDRCRDMDKLLSPIRIIVFTDLDFADDVALLAEMLSVLVLALEVMNEEAQPLGLTINWAKTKIQTTDVTVPPGSTV